MRYTEIMIRLSHLNIMVTFRGVLGELVNNYNNIDGHYENGVGAGEDFDDRSQLVEQFCLVIFSFHLSVKFSPPVTDRP